MSQTTPVEMIVGFPDWDMFWRKLPRECWAVGDCECIALALVL